MESSSFMAKRILGKDVHASKAGEKNAVIWKLLVNHEGQCKPKSVVADMVQRMPGDLRHEVEETQKRFQNLATNLIKQGGKPRKVYNKPGSKIIKHTISVLHKYYEDHGQMVRSRTMATCQVQKKSVCVFTPEASDSFTLHMAGVNCYDWSSMGAMKGWLGESCLSCVLWLLERMVEQDWGIVVECVWNFPHEVLREALGFWHTLVVIRMSPTIQGIPSERNRKYMLLTLNAKLKWNNILDDMTG